MAKGPKNSNEGTPKEYPNTVPPTELYPTSDIRFVMVEIGKLTKSVDRLIDDVKDSSSRLGSIENTLTLIKGGLFACIFLIPIIGGLLWWLIGDKMESVRDDILNRPPAAQTQTQTTQ
jgi:hypothetical protein